MSIKGFKAVTESGSVYERQPNDTRVTVTRGISWQLPSSLHNAILRSAPEAELVARGLDWEYINSLPFVDLPVVGERLVVTGHKNWRISTTIRSVEELT